MKKFEVTKSHIVRSLEKNWNHDGVHTHKTLCQVRMLVDSLFLGEDPTEIVINFNADAPKVKNKIGIHMTQGFEDEADFDSRLFDAVENALRDGFPAIYIYKAE